jgi:hypothetical protein
LPYIPRYGKLQKGFRAVPASADTFPDTGFADSMDERKKANGDKIFIAQLNM